MNKDHYVSYEVARKLQESNIEFSDSEKVWTRYMVQIKDCFEWSDWYLAKKDSELEGILFSRHVMRLSAIHAPSLSETLDKLGPVYLTRLVFKNYAQCFNSHILDYYRNPTVASTRVDAAALMLLKLKEEENGR